MIETSENAVQLGAAALLALVCAGAAVRQKKEAYGILALFYAATALGDLYWLLYLAFYHVTPMYSYISEFAWYAAWSFLILLLRQEQEDVRRGRHPALLLVPVFTGGMCLFYMRWGDPIGNLVTAVFMTILLLRSLPGCFGGSSAKKPLYRAVAVYCLIEYSMWTASCFWSGDGIANPYLWFDALFTVCIVHFFPVLGKAVRG